MYSPRQGFPLQRSPPVTLFVGFPRRLRTPACTWSSGLPWPLSIFRLLFWACPKDHLLIQSRSPRGFCKAQHILREAGGAHPEGAHGGQRWDQSVPCSINWNRDKGKWDHQAPPTAAPSGCPGNFPSPGRWWGRQCEVNICNLSAG